MFRAPLAGDVLRLVRCTQPRSGLAAGNRVAARAALRGVAEEKARLRVRVPMKLG
jgi:hypothetical protein